MDMQHQIKGSTVNLGERVSGPPSKLYPFLRDLADAKLVEPMKYEIIAEIDTLNDRLLARIEGHSVGHGEQAPALTIMKANHKGDIPERGNRISLSFAKVIAVRVVKLSWNPREDDFRAEEVAPDHKV